MMSPEEQLLELESYQQVMDDFRSFMSQPDKFLNFVLTGSQQDKDHFNQMTDLMVVVQNKLKHSILNFEQLHEFNECSRNFFNNIVLNQYKKESLAFISKIK